jgi:MFS superfamily sulfate permease-like transporter
MMHSVLNDTVSRSIVIGFVIGVGFLINWANLRHWKFRNKRNRLS